MFDFVCDNKYNKWTLISSRVVDDGFPQFGDPFYAGEAEPWLSLVFSKCFGRHLKSSDSNWNLPFRWVWGRDSESFCTSMPSNQCQFWPYPDQRPPRSLTSLPKQSRHTTSWKRPRGRFWGWRATGGSLIRFVLDHESGCKLRELAPILT